MTLLLLLLLRLLSCRARELRPEPPLLLGAAAASGGWGVDLLECCVGQGSALVLGFCAPCVKACLLCV